MEKEEKEFEKIETPWCFFYMSLTVDGVCHHVS